RAAGRGGGYGLLCGPSAPPPPPGGGGGGGGGWGGGRGPSGKRRLDVGGELFRPVGRRVAAHDVTVPVDQKLGEIPLDPLSAEEAGRCLLQRLEQRVGVQAVDLGLGEHREAHVVIVGAEFLD